MPRGYCSKTGRPIPLALAMRRGYFYTVPGTRREVRTYQIWRCMKGRCFNEHHPNFQWYGMRGIGVCAEWQASYAAFREWFCAALKRWDGEPREASLDRIDENGNYEPDNCRILTLYQNRVRSLHGDARVGL